MKATLLCFCALSIAACTWTRENPPPGYVTTTKTTTTTTVKRTWTADDEAALVSCRMMRAHFDSGSDAIDTEDKIQLNRVAACLRDNHAIKVSIEGNSDDRGTEEQNLILAEKRADAIEDYLLSKGVNEGQLATVAFGSGNPLCTEQNEACWSVNRRATVRPKAATR